MSTLPFCSVELAERVERVETRLITAATEAARQRAGEAVFVIPVGGGAACYAEDGSPMNKVVGLGFGGAPSDDALEEIEQAFAARATATQVELATLADPAIGTALTNRGYQLVSFENVLGRSLDGELQPVTAPGIEVRPARPDEFEAWLEVVIDGFAHPDDQGVPSNEDFPREVIGRAITDMAEAGVRSYVALVDGDIAGEGSMRTMEGVAQLTGAATAPRYRRRGVQTALLSARLDAAAEEGCDIAVVTTQPGSKSQENVQRRGFHLLYTRAVLVKPPS
jgi:GNAT superfamily N-acetyltransferase